MPEEMKNFDFPVPLQKGAVYGPLHSRRLGLSLGINLLPGDRKICNLDCLYCYYGRTDFRLSADACPPAEIILAEVESEFRKNPLLDYITFSGNGAASLHPQFPALVRSIRLLRDKYYPGIPLAILSNSAGLSSEEILETYSLFDHPIMKLDTGDETVFRKLNRPKKGITLKGIVEVLKSMRGITIQTLFTEGICNCKGKALEKWLRTISEINPAAIQIYTLDRSLPQQGLIKLEHEELLGLQKLITAESGLPVKAFTD